MNVIQSVWWFISSHVLSEILILISIPFLSGYSIYRVIIAVFNAGKPRELAVSGLGGAVWLCGYMVHGLEADFAYTDLDTSLWAIGMALMLGPKLIGMWREHAAPHRESP